MRTRYLPLLALWSSEIAFVATYWLTWSWEKQCEQAFAEQPEVLPGFVALQNCTPPLWITVSMGIAALTAVIAPFLTWETLVRRSWPAAGFIERILIVVVLLLDLPILAGAGTVALNFIRGL